MGGWVHVGRWRVLAVAPGLVCIGVGGLALAHPGSAHPKASAVPASQSGCVHRVTVATRPPCLQTGRRLARRPGAVRWGTGVGSSALFGDRVFLDANEGVALADSGSAEYPALSTDGGRGWRIDGPQLHVDAADGAEGVGSVGIAGPRTLFAYGSSVVDVTTDRGRSWWETFLGEDVVAVVPGYEGELIAYVEQSVSSQHLNPAVTWQYVSRDGGRHWRYSTEFAGIPG